MADSMTEGPSIVPESGHTPSAHEIPQALHDSEINFKIECFYDSVWTATLGDQMNGWGDHTRRPNYVDALLDLKDMAIERFPNSTFAKKYAGITFAEEAVIAEEEELTKAREDFTRLSLSGRP
jgi:hypothetical protein